MDIKIITNVTSEPLLQTLGSERLIDKYLNYTDANTDETALITKLSIAAREVCEKFLNLSLGEKIIQVYVDKDWIKRRNLKFDLPYGPISLEDDGSLTEVLAIGYDNTETEVTYNSGYYLYGNDFKSIKFATITGTFGNQTSECDYKVKYSCGYSVANIPPALIAMMCKLVYAWYHNRDNWIPVMNSDAEMIGMPFRRRAWF